MELTAQSTMSAPASAQATLAAAGFKVPAMSLIPNKWVPISMILSTVSSVNTNLQLLQVVQSIENSEDVNTSFLGLLNEMVNSIVRQRRVSHSVGSSQQHLERNVWNGFSKLSQSIPWVLVQETHGNVESGTSPTLQGKCVPQGMSGGWGDVQKVYGSDSSGKQRLVGVSPSSVHDHTTVKGSDLVGKSLWTVVQQVLSERFWRSRLDVDLPAVHVVDDWDIGLSVQLWQANLTLDRGSIDTEVGKVRQQLLSSVLGLNHLEQRWGVVDKSGPTVTRNERWVGQQSKQERNVGLDTSNSELDQRSNHLSSGNLVVRTRSGTLDQHGVVVGRDNGTGKTVTTVQSHTVTTRRSVNLDLTSVWLEVLGWVFGSDSALDCKTSGGDLVLQQTKLLQRSTSSNLDLSSNNVNTSDFLSDCVFDLDSWVDLNEIVSVLCINQKLSSTCVSIVGSLCQLNSIGQNGVSDLNWQGLCRSNLNHLLVSSLNRTVSFEQMDNVSVVIGQKLHLNVLWFVQEPFDKAGTVTKGGLCLRGCSAESVRNVLTFTNDSHTTTSTTKGGLDDDRVAVFVHKVLSLVNRVDWAICSGNNRNIALASQVSGTDLVSDRVDDCVGWTHPNHARFLDLAGKVRIFRKETVAGVDHGDTMFQSDVDDLVALQIGLHW
ncbi:hypothetical protein OGAPHI_005360 [Ogataea philodendri]|uniref:Uncharacterized protein n=1 Tax=Ogataea philodendri TaxID=1378263 RepID=A0A9P8P1F3_9ASCO|nr:uncharacterized protein OGAPHI_005360 [Ogataea philodendri]KAH3663370.1 hypothetical protein OGAPHI_005360 [Ogataea philodendri]